MVKRNENYTTGSYMQETRISILASFERRKAQEIIFYNETRSSGALHVCTSKAIQEMYLIRDSHISDSKEATRSKNVVIRRNIQARILDTGTNTHTHT